MRAAAILAAIVSAVAGPAAAETWWMGEANPAGAGFIDVDKVAARPDGGRTATVMLVVPQGSRIAERQTAYLATTYAFDCPAGARRPLGGSAFGLGGEPILTIEEQPTAEPMAPPSPDWKMLKLACATTDGERAAFGKKIGHATISQLVIRFRPPAPR